MFYSHGKKQTRTQLTIAFQEPTQSIAARLSKERKEEEEEERQNKQ